MKKQDRWFVFSPIHNQELTLRYQISKVRRERGIGYVYYIYYLLYIYIYKGNDCKSINIVVINMHIQYYNYTQQIRNDT